MLRIKKRLITYYVLRKFILFLSYERLNNWFEILESSVSFDVSVFDVTIFEVAVDVVVVDTIVISKIYEYCNVYAQWVGIYVICIESKL